MKTIKKSLREGKFNVEITGVPTSVEEMETFLAKIGDDAVEALATLACHEFCFRQVPGRKDMAGDNVLSFVEMLRKAATKSAKDGEPLATDKKEGEAKWTKLVAVATEKYPIAKDAELEDKKAQQRARLAFIEETFGMAVARATEQFGFSFELDPELTVEEMLPHYCRALRLGKVAYGQRMAKAAAESELL